MIQSMLLKKNGAWETPTHALLTPLEETAQFCSTKCDATINRLELLSSGRPSTDNFKRDLCHLKGKVSILTERIKKFRLVPLGDIERKALTELLVEFAEAVRDLKGINTGLLQFDAADRVFIDDILEQLTQLVGEVPRGFYATKTTELAQAVRALPQFPSLCDGLNKFKDETSALPYHPSLAISFSQDDHEMATLIADLLKMTINNVHFIDDCGPHAGRKIGEFRGLFHTVDYILLIGSTSYGRQARSEAPSDVKSESLIIADRYFDRPEYVISLIIEGSHVTSLPNQMANAQIGYLNAQSAFELISSLSGIVTRIFSGRRPDASLTTLNSSLLSLAEAISKTEARSHSGASRTQNLEPLLSVYRSQGYLTRFLDRTPFPIEESYINVTLVDQKVGEVVEEGTKRDPDTSPFQGKGVELSKLFDGNRQLYIEGAAGSGKTTLCRYLVSSWANLSLERRQETLWPWANRFEAIILLPLREIRSLPETAHLNDFILKRYPTLSLKLIDPSKTLYILDGFDEIASLKELCGKNREDKRWNIVKTLLEQPHWMVTSRPNLFSVKLLGCRHLHNNGFTNENITAYVRCFCRDFKLQSQRLERTISSQKELQVLAHNPLYLELVCSLWKKNPGLIYALNNLSPLYDKIAALLFRRYLMRIGVNTKGLFLKDVLTHEKVSPYRECLEEIAFLSKQSGGNRIIPDLYQPILEKIPTGEREAFGRSLFDQLGLLTPVGNAKEPFEQIYVFINLSFEEYFAARYVVSRLESSSTLIGDLSAADWLKKNCFATSFEKVIDFTAALSISDNQLNTLANALLSEREFNANEWSYPLHRAVHLHLLKLVDLLLRKGAKIDVATKEGKQPLHIAAQCGYKEIVEMLLNKGAKIDAASYKGMLPLHEAAQNGHKEVVELLLSKGAKIDAANDYGWQPLYEAARNGHKEVFELLISKGSKVDTANNDGLLQLHVAAQNGHKEVVELLLSNGAKIDATDNERLQPLHGAARFGHKEVAELLLNMGAKVEIADNNGRQPLHWAARKGHKEVIELLLSKGAKIDAADKTGQQPLHGAALNGCKEVSELLLNSGAKIDATDTVGMQPLHWAARNGHKEVVELLLSKGAKNDAVDKGGRKPINLARANGHKEIVELLLRKST